MLSHLARGPAIAIAALPVFGLLPGASVTTASCSACHPTPRQFSSTPRCEAQRFHALDPMLRTLDPYKELGVSREANQDEIQNAYRALLFSLHPDRQNIVKPDTADESEADAASEQKHHRRPLHGHRSHTKRAAADPNKERLIRVLAAYELLRNPEKRRRIDQGREWQVNWNGSYVRRETRNRPAGFYGNAAGAGTHKEAGGEWADPFPGNYEYREPDHESMWSPPAYIEKTTSFTLMGIYLLTVGAYFAYDYTEWQRKQTRFAIEPSEEYDAVAIDTRWTENPAAMTASIIAQQRGERVRTQAAKPTEQIQAYLARIGRGVGGYGRPKDATVDTRGVGRKSEPVAA